MSSGVRVIFVTWVAVMIDDCQRKTAGQPRWEIQEAVEMLSAYMQRLTTSKEYAMLLQEAHDVMAERLTPEEYKAENMSSMKMYADLMSD